MTVMRFFSLFSDDFIPMGFLLPVFVIVVGLLITKVMRRKRLSIARSERLSLRENPESIKFQTHLYFLQNISRRIREDQLQISNSLSGEQSALDENVYRELESLQPFDCSEVKTFLQQKYSVQAREAEVILRTLEALESDFLTIKSQLQQVTEFTLARFVPIEFLEGYPSNNVSMQTQTYGTDNQGLHEEASSSELVTRFMAITKESFARLASENKTRRNEMIQSISRYLEQSHKNIQREITIFSSVAARNEREDQDDVNTSLIAEVEKVEKNLLETFIFLNRQRFEMETMKKTLTYFTKKFLYVAAKFDTFWKQSDSSYNSASQRLKEIEVVWSSIIEKVDSSSDCLLQQSRNFSNVISTVDKVLKMKEGEFDFDLSFTCTKLDGAGEYQKRSWLQSIDHMNQKLNDLLVIAENSGESLGVLTRKSENLENFHDLIMNMADGFDTLLNFFLSSINRARMLKNHQSIGLDRKEQNCNDIEIYDSGNSMMSISEKKDHSIDDRLWNEVRRELNAEFPNLETDTVIFLLKDIVKSTWDLVYYRKTLVNYGRNNYKAENAENLTEKSVHNYTYIQSSTSWENIPSEYPLADVSCDFLVQNSDESDDTSERSLQREDHRTNSYIFQ